MGASLTSLVRSYSPLSIFSEMICAVVRNASSTFSAVFAEVSKNITSCLLANVYPSSKLTSLLKLIVSRWD